LHDSGVGSGGLSAWSAVGVYKAGRNYMKLSVDEISIGYQALAKGYLVMDKIADCLCWLDTPTNYLTYNMLLQSCWKFHASFSSQGYDGRSRTHSLGMDAH
jgi:hypothetical protein